MNRMTKLWEDFVGNWDIYIVIIGSIIVGIVSFILLTVGQMDIAPVLSLTLTMLGLVAVSLRRDRQSDTNIKESLLELAGTVGSLNRNKAFDHQHDAYRYLIDIINRDGVKEAVFLQYSSRTCLDVLRTVLSKEAKVTVFLQHEDMAARVGSQYQANRIRGATMALRTDLNGSLKKPENLKVYKYRTLGSVSAIKIDDQVLCMGWYVYKHVDKYTDRNMASDEVELLGHNIAALIVWKGTHEFEALNKTFDMLEKNYRRNSEEVQL